MNHYCFVFTEISHFSISQFSQTHHLFFRLNMMYFLEREIAMQFIQSILLASIQKQKNKDSTTQTHLPRALTPLTRTSQQPSSLSKPKKDHHHTKACGVCARKNLEAALQQLQVVAAHPQ